MSDGLTIHGVIISQPTRTVETFCNMSGIPYTHVHVDLKSGQNLCEEYTSINPFQSLPAIVHNGYNLWESAAIIAYLADAFNVDNQWYPKDIKIRGRINAYLHWHHQGTREQVAGYLFAKVIGPMVFGTPQITEEQENIHKKKLNDFFDTLTWQLASTGYAGRTAGPTIADVFCYNEILSVVLMIGVTLDSHPAVKKWYDEIGAVPGVRDMTNAVMQMLAAMAQA